MLIMILPVSEVRAEKSQMRSEQRVNSKTVFSLITPFRYMLLIMYAAYFLIPQFGVFFLEYIDFKEVPLQVFGVIYLTMNLLPLIGTYLYKKYFSLRDVVKVLAFSVIMSDPIIAHMIDRQSIRHIRNHYKYVFPPKERGAESFLHSIE